MLRNAHFFSSPNFASKRTASPPLDSTLGGTNALRPLTMNPQLLAEIGRVGGDPADPVWQWLLLNGPHGGSFTWRQTRREPPGYVGVEHLQSIVAEKARADQGFLAHARQAVAKALSSSDAAVLCRAIQVAAVVGSAAELERLTSFASHEHVSVAANAKAGAFHLRRSLRSGTGP